MRNTVTRFAVWAVVALTSANPTLAEVAKITCRFDGLGSPLSFIADLDKSTAYVDGNAGANSVLMHVGSKAVSFMERLPTGAVQTTTIALPEGTAMHSRHTLLGDAFVPAQHSGRCE